MERWIQGAERTSEWFVTHRPRLPRVVFLADLVPRGGEAPWLPPRVGREAHSASQVAEASDARVFAEQSDGKERREDAPR
jgi:hypothetical protein